MNKMPDQRPILYTPESPDVGDASRTENGEDSATVVADRTQADELARKVAVGDELSEYEKVAERGVRDITGPAGRPLPVRLRPKSSPVGGRIEPSVAGIRHRSRPALNYLCQSARVALRRGVELVAHETSQCRFVLVQNEKT